MKRDRRRAEEILDCFGMRLYEIRAKIREDEVQRGWVFVHIDGQVSDGGEVEAFGMEVWDYCDGLLFSDVRDPRDTWDGREGRVSVRRRVGVFVDG